MSDVGADGICKLLLPRIDYASDPGGKQMSMLMRAPSCALRGRRDACAVSGPNERTEGSQGATSVVERRHVASFDAGQSLIIARHVVEFLHKLRST